MLGSHSPSHGLVRAVANDTQAHGDLTFAIGFAVIVGGGILTFVGASALRIAGLI